jgi:conjugal transfer pilus assembly protein TraU
MNYADLRTRLLATVVAMLLVIGVLLTPAHAALPTGGATCHGRFANPITDICWSCLFPLTIGGIGIVSDGQPDIGNPSSPVCYCNNPPRLGISIGFWEPVRMVDVTRSPFCMVGLGGLSLDPGIGAPRGAQVGHDSQTRNSFYQVHWYANPILAWLEVLLDFPCLEQGSLDLAYLTEVDPLWSDDELSAILNPEAVLFANPVAKAACAADCVAASAGFPVASLFWCAGCQGSIYPMTGHVTTHIGGVQASVLLTQRMTAKMHRQLTTFATAGSRGLCGAYPLPIFDKTHYKLQMTYPVPATAKVGGQCCQPYGRTTMIWGSGKSFPVSGEDFSYQIFRKRNCCAGAW